MIIKKLQLPRNDKKSKNDAAKMKNIDDLKILTSKKLSQKQTLAIE